ncbi:MAG: hypothetical protein FJX54_14000 [Alphaproteobacteria bacterium]|nr:hypothetical protein [Alphaproteobacteria bacterium]
MVTITGPASLSAPDLFRASIATVALDRLKQRPQPSDAQAQARATLDVVHRETQDAPQKAAAAKVEYLRNKLMAIKLAAGTASATGDLKFARSALHDMRALTKELTQALKDAGVVKESGLPTDPRAGKEVAADELGQAGEDAKGLIKDMRKVLSKLRLALVAAQIRGAGPEEIRAAEKQLLDTEKELQSLSASLSAKGGGRTLDLRA